MRKLAESEEIEIDTRRESPEVIRAINVAYMDKYGQAWPDSAKDVVRRSRLDTTLRLTPA